LPLYMAETANLVIEASRETGNCAFQVCLLQGFPHIPTVTAQASSLPNE
jgi:hypothetical protein